MDNHIQKRAYAKTDEENSPPHDHAVPNFCHRPRLVLKSPAIKPVAKTKNSGNPTCFEVVF